MHLSRSLFWSAMLTLLVPGCYPQTGTGPRDVTLRPVEVIELAEEPVDDTVSLIGRIEPWQEGILYFEVSGVVAEVFVEEGDSVESGDRIARLVLDDYALGVSKAEAELENSRAKWQLLDAGTRKEDLDAARADYARAGASAKYWANEFERTKRLYETKTVSASELSRVWQEYESASQQQRSSWALLQRAIAGPREEEIKAAAAQVEALAQASALATRQLQKATLRAPFAGRVEKRLLDVGTYINVFPTGGVPVVHLVDLDTVDAVVDVPERLLSRFADEQTIEVVSAVDPTILAPGRLISLGQVADRASGTYELRLRIANPQHRFKGRMVVIARSTTQTPRRAIHVPATAVLHAYGQKPYVLLVEPGKQEVGRVVAREVKLGPMAAERIEIAAGLSDGALLIVRGQDLVVAGDQVKYQATSATPISPASGEQPQRELP